MNKLAALSVVIWIHVINNFLNWLIFLYTTWGWKDNGIMDEYYNANFIVKYFATKGKKDKNINLQDIFITKYYLPYEILCNSNKWQDCKKIKEIIKEDLKRYKEKLQNWNLTKIAKSYKDEANINIKSLENLLNK